MFSLPGKNRLITRFLLTYIPLAFIPLLLIGLLLITATEKNMKRSIYNTHEEIAKRAANEISLYVKNAQNIIKTLSFIPSIEELNKFETANILNKYIEREKTFREIAVINTDGTLFSSTSLTPDIKNKKDEEFFKKSINGNDYISPIILDETLPIIRISVPIIYLNNIKGVLLAEVNVKSIWDLVEGITFLQEGRIMLVSNNGTIIAHSNTNRVYSSENLSDLQLVKELLRGRNGTGRFRDKDNTEMISSYFYIDDLQWGLITYQPVEIAFALSHQMRMQFTLILVLSTIVAILISIAVTRNLLKPIKKLVAGAKQFSSGNLDYKIEIEEANEIGLLAGEFNKMTSSLKEYQKRLKQAERLATLSKFASVVAHEIRNPLNAMMINLEIIKRDLSKNTYVNKIQGYIDIIYNEILRMDELVKNYLSLAKPSPPNLEHEHLQLLINEVILSTSARALQQGIRIERKFRIDPKAKIDKNQIKQVFLNIILNAIQAMPGGGKLIIHIIDDKTYNNKFDNKYKPSENEILIVFSDMGRGIPKDDLSEVFDYFYSSKKKGTGLGLSIALQIIKEHNGKILLNSEINKGTNVFIYLPKS